MYLDTRPFCWYQVQGHLSKSRSNIKVAIFKKRQLPGHRRFTNTSCSFVKEMILNAGFPFTGTH